MQCLQTDNTQKTKIIFIGSLNSTDAKPGVLQHVNSAYSKLKKNLLQGIGENDDLVLAFSRLKNLHLFLFQSFTQFKL